MTKHLAVHLYKIRKPTPNVLFSVFIFVIKKYSWNNPVLTCPWPWYKPSFSFPFFRVLQVTWFSLCLFSIQAERPGDRRRCRETRLWATTPSRAWAWKEWRTFSDPLTTSNKISNAWSSPWEPRTTLPERAMTCTWANQTTQMVNKIISTVVIWWALTQEMKLPDFGAAVDESLINPWISLGHLTVWLPES